MVCIHRSRDAPANYRLCNQTITLYHAELQPTFSCRRIVIDGAWMGQKKEVKTDKLGSVEENRTQLVIPAEKRRYVSTAEYTALTEAAKAEAYTLTAGDRVFRGIGPEIETVDAWRAFLPVKQPGLTIIKTVEPVYWENSCCHVEASG